MTQTATVMPDSAPTAAPWGIAGVLLLASVLAAWTGDQLTLQHDGQMMLWPIGAVSLIAAWLLPLRLAIPILVIGPLVNAGLMDHDLPTRAGRVVGACATGLIGASLLRAAGVKRLFGDVSDVLCFLALGVFTAPALGGGLSIFVMWQLNGMPTAEISLFWWVCWATESIAILLIVPLAMGLRTFARWPGRYQVVSLFVVVAEAAIVFDDLLPERFAMQLPLAFIAYPILLWAAFRVSLHWCALLLAVHAGFALWATSMGMGPFTRETTVENLLLLHGNLGLLSCTTLLLASSLKERRDAVAQLRDSETRYRLIVENQSESVVKLDRHGRVIFATPNAERWMPMAARPGENCLEWLCAEAEEPASAVMQSLLDGQRVELQSETAGVWLQWRISPLFDAGELASVIVVGHDISARRHAQEEARQHLDDLTHLGRISDMAQMAGGLAHELNQPLTAAITFAQASKRLLTDDPSTAEARGAIDRVVHNAERAAEIIRHMREFVRKAPAEREQHALEQLVREVFSLLAFESRKQRVSLILDAPHKHTVVSVSRVQFHQVLVNLFRNAMQAMSSADTPDKQIVVRIRSDESGVWLDVRDTGPGMPAETRQVVFEPFRSESSDGLGLGLSITRAIVEAHDGDINFVDSPIGCCARVRLPAVNAGQQRIAL